MTFCMNIYDPWGTTSNGYCDPLTFIPAPPLARHVLFWNCLDYSQKKAVIIPKKKQIVVQTTHFLCPHASNVLPASSKKGTTAVSTAQKMLQEKH